MEEVAEQIQTATAILRRKQVEKLTGLSCSTIYSEMAKGRFPKPIKITAKAVGWQVNAIDAWMASRVAA